MTLGGQVVDVHHDLINASHVLITKAMNACFGVVDLAMMRQPQSMAEKVFGAALLPPLAGSSFQTGAHGMCWCYYLARAQMC